MPIPRTSQLLKEPHRERPIEQASADSREERNVISKSSESDRASSDVIDESEEDHSLPKHPDGMVIYTRRVKGGKLIIKNIDQPAPAVATSKMQRQTKTTQPAPMIRAQDKENKGPRALVPVSGELLSNSENDKPVRPEGRKKVVKASCW